MQIDILTLFPEMFRGPFDISIVGRARERGLVRIRLVPLRPFGVGRHRQTDDYPYGGGPGMVMRPEPIVEAAEWAMAHVPHPPTVILTSAQGRPLTQALLRAWAERPYLLVVAGHYEGVDERVVDLLEAEEVSLGDFVLTGGEIPAMAIVDGVTRLLPGVLGDPDGARQDSFGPDPRWLEGPQYTRPLVYRGLAVPDVLRSGHHARIAAWRREQAEAKARRLRPEWFGTPAAGAAAPAVTAPGAEEDRGD
ncbi:MAG: tRNA (guanosine(37)-N1)-methyltransferase TrmD [Actinomycetia bacterium]|nr:tRNA (guanosine(37)-N1)-methyltransferase TrmD [Actinomycetes bacterium]